VTITVNGKTTTYPLHRGYAKIQRHRQKAEALDEYKISRDEYNILNFKAVTTDGLRIKIKPKPDFSGRIMEWKVK